MAKNVSDMDSDDCVFAARGAIRGPNAPQERVSAEGRGMDGWMYLGVVLDAGADDGVDCEFTLFVESRSCHDEWLR